MRIKLLSGMNPPTFTRTKLENASQEVGLTLVGACLVGKGCRVFEIAGKCWDPSAESYIQSLPKCVIYEIPV